MLLMLESVGNRAQFIALWLEAQMKAILAYIKGRS